MPGGYSGYVQLRRGLSQHVRDGRLTFFEASLYAFILMDADPSSGLCHGSAGLYAAIYGLSSRTCRDALEKLESKGYLRRFSRQGRHGSYPILINKFKCSDGAMKGRYVNALKTEDYRNILYESRDESVNGDGDESVNEDVNESAASNENREGRLEMNARALKAGKGLAQELDPRYHDFADLLGVYWRRANPELGMPWGKKEIGALKDLLDSCPNLTSKQFSLFLDNRLKSEEVAHSNRICFWLAYVTQYSTPLNKFGKPLVTGGLSANLPNRGPASIVAVCAGIIAGRQHNGPAGEDGDLSPSEDGPRDAEDHTGDVHGLSEKPRPAGVSGGHGGAVGKPKGGWPDSIS